MWNVHFLCDDVKHVKIFVVSTHRENQPAKTSLTSARTVLEWRNLRMSWLQSNRSSILSFLREWAITAPVEKICQIWVYITWAIHYLKLKWNGREVTKLMKTSFVLDKRRYCNGKKIVSILGCNVGILLTWFEINNFQKKKIIGTSTFS